MLSTLDFDDLQILQLLQHDASLTHKEIADKIGKSVSPVNDRIKRLQNEGYIQRYVALLDKKKIGQPLIAYTQVQLKEHTESVMRTFEKEVIKFDEVMECYHMSGQFDFLMKVTLKNMDEYYQFVIDRLARLPNIGTVQSFFVLHEAKVETAFRMKMPPSPQRSSKKPPLTARRLLQE